MKDDQEDGDDNDVEDEGSQSERKDDEDYDAKGVDLMALQIWEQNEGFSKILNVISTLRWGERMMKMMRMWKMNAGRQRGRMMKIMMKMMQKKLI